MALNAEDRAYIEKVNDDTRKHIEQIHDLKMDLILKDLKFIKEQTAATNGKVITHTGQITELQKQVIHTAETCPNQKVINALYAESMDDRSKKKVLSNQRKDLVIIVTLVGIIFAIIEVVIKFFSNSST